MYRTWLESYPAGVPADIDPDRFASIPDFLAYTAARHADRPAFHNLGHSLSYADLRRLARAFAAFLQGLPGMAPGERVAIMAPNLLQYPVALFGILQAGLTVVNVNPLYTPRELEQQLVDSGARAVVVLENFAATVAAVLPRTPVEYVITTRLGDLLPAPKRWFVDMVAKHVKKLVPPWRIDGAIGFRGALARGALATLHPVAIGRNDVAFLQYTGGTTGVPKGAMLTHRNLLANLEQTGAWVSTGFEEGTEVAVTPLPMYHIFCLTSTLAYLKCGALIVLVTNPRDVAALVGELRRWKCSVFTGVDTLFNSLLDAPGFAGLDFSRLKVTVGGGAPVQRRTAERWHAVTGCHITVGYGLTEASPGVSANPVGTAWNGTIGLPFPSTYVSVRDDDFRELPPWTGDGDVGAHTGELCVRGPQVMQGYWNAPAETARVLGDGWLRTGDIGHADANGRYTLTDRKKDLILVSGFNVYPSEIESVLAAHPGVLDCGAVGVPDDRSGEAVKVVIVRRDPALTKEAVVAYCRQQLTGYKVPRIVEFSDALPKTPIGKVLRHELRRP